MHAVDERELALIQVLRLALGARHVHDRRREGQPPPAGVAWLGLGVRVRGQGQG